MLLEKGPFSREVSSSNHQCSGEMLVFSFQGDMSEKKKKKKKTQNIDHHKTKT